MAIAPEINPDKQHMLFIVLLVLAVGVSDQGDRAFMSQCVCGNSCLYPLIVEPFVYALSDACLVRHFAILSRVYFLSLKKGLRSRIFGGLRRGLMTLKSRFFGST